MRYNGRVSESVANPLKGRRVVVTRAAEQSQRLVEELERRGALPTVLPMVAFAPPDDVGSLDAAIQNLPTFDWIFLTSQNTFRAVCERCSALSVPLNVAFSRVRIAAVGPATAEAVDKAGLDVSYVPSKHQGVAMAEELAEKVRRKRVFLPRSDRANPELVGKLKAIGAEVVEVCAYKTVRPDKSELERITAALQQASDAVLFFSPSAVHHMQELLGADRFLELSRRAVFAAIGPVTGEALRQARVERVLLARDTWASAIVGTLADYFAQEGVDSRSRSGMAVQE